MEETKYRFLFSVVMAVYNVEPYLREAVESVLAQDVGFEKIQILLVDDGSTDGSGELCDRYQAEHPQNIRAIHKKNGGAGSARNVGFDAAEGEILSCMDPDDKMAPDAFRKAYDFLKEHWDETDAVSLPLFNFEGSTGPHLLNNKFQKGTRVIDLDREYDTVQLHICSVFLKREVADRYRMDEKLILAEDAQMMTRLLGEKHTLGVLADTKYFYRRRRSNNSLTQVARKKKGVFNDYMERFILSVLEYYQRTEGKIPKFVQYTTMFDFQNQVRTPFLPTAILTKDEYASYLELVRRAARLLDDDIILRQEQILPDYKEFLMQQKKREDVFPRTVLLYYNAVLEDFSGELRQMEVPAREPAQLILQGIVPMAEDQAARAELSVSVGGKRFPCPGVREQRGNMLLYGGKVVRGYQFFFPLPAEEVDGEKRISFFLKIGEKEAPVECRFGTYAPLGPELKNSYCCAGGCAVFLKGEELWTAPWGKRELHRREGALRRELLRSDRLGARKAAAVKLFCAAVGRLRRRPICLLLGEREEDRARIENAVDGLRGRMRFYSPGGVLGKPGCLLKRVYGNDRLYKLLFLISDYLWVFDASAVINPYAVRVLYRDLLARQKYLFFRQDVEKDLLYAEEGVKHDR